MIKILEFWKKYSFLLLMAFIFCSLFDLRFALAAVICMGGPLLIAPFKGRYWCGNLCPRGSFYDNLMIKISKKRQIPKILKSRIFRGLMVLLLMSMFTMGIIKNWGDAYGIGMVFYRIIVITTIVGIILSLFFNHRTWCQICPMGTLSSVISKSSNKRKVLQVSTDCIHCKRCQKQCPLGIVPSDYQGTLLDHPDCIQCKKCVIICPKNAIGYDKIVNS